MARHPLSFWFTARKPLTLFVVVFFFISLAACGGAGSNGGTKTFAYVSLEGSSGTVSVAPHLAGFNVDTQTGALTSVDGSPFDAPFAGPLTATPDGTFLYLSFCADPFGPGQGVCTIVRYAIGSDGNLEDPFGETVPGIGGMQIVPSGKFMYTFGTQIVTNQIFGFQITSSGRLTALPAVAPSLPGMISSISVTPSGKFLYALTFVPFRSCVATSFDPCQNLLIQGYSIDQNTGALTAIPEPPVKTQLQTFADAPSYFASATMDTQSRFLYVTAYQDPTLPGFAIDQATGALTPVPGSPPTVNRSAAGGMGVGDPGGRFLFFPIDGVTAFTIQSSGVLTSVPGSPFAASALAMLGVGNLSVDPTGHFLYFLSGASVEKVNIGANGSLDLNNAETTMVPNARDPNDPKNQSVLAQGQVLIVTRKP